MDYVRFGTSSLKVSRIGLGMMGIGSPSWRSWVLDEAAGRPLVEAALNGGINLFDTCDYYSAGKSEEALGSILADLGVRDQVVIATKVGNPVGKGPNASGYSRKHIVEAAEASLRRLKTDRIDIYQTHIWNSETNIEEMVEAFDLLVRQGKVLYVGATDIPTWQLSRAVYHARHHNLASFASVQHHYNAIWREDERDLIPFAVQEGMALLPYSPLGRGFLTGMHWQEKRTERSRSDDYAWTLYGRDSDIAVAEAIRDVGNGLGLTPAQVALLWVLKRSRSAIPLLGIRTLQQLSESVAALDHELSSKDANRIDLVYEPRSRGGHF